MQDLDDNTLLREYAEHRSEEAFETLVTRHVSKVYSVALRHTGKPHQAEEITQTVFVLLATRAASLGKRVILEGWLYQTARLTALTSIRGDIRRVRREQEASMQTMTNENEAAVWTQIAPLLDKAIATLNETDRHAVVLRFFYGKSLREVGASLGASEGAATARVHRALEKLRHFFLQHGVKSTPDIIAGAISANSVQAAPAALAKAITAVAMTKGLAGGGASAMLAKGAMNTMTWLKTTTLAVILANAFLSQKIVATHFDFAGNPNGWMKQSTSSLVWLVVGIGFPLFFLALGYLMRFVPGSSFKLPNGDYWTAPERRGELDDYLFHHFLWMAFFGAIFMLTLILLQIQANHQAPAHLSTPLVLSAGGCFVAATIVWLWKLVRHFDRV
jgi:RNA polymerase sigma factor (sigma-70 family)